MDQAEIDWGQSTAEIARKAGKSLRWAQKEKRKRLGNQEAKIDLSPDQVSEIVRLYQKGHGLKAVAKAVLGKESARPIIRTLEAAGVEIRKSAEGQSVSPHRRKNSAMWKSRRARNALRTGWDKALKGSGKVSDLPLFDISPAERWKRRYHSEPEFRLRAIYKARFHKIVKDAGISDARTHEFVGCSKERLKEWIESFFEPWMTWGNLGVGDGKWNVDHVVPCSWFDQSNREHRKLCWNFQNLRPLCSIENISRNNSGAEALSWLAQLPRTPITQALFAFAKSQLAERQAVATRVL